MTKRTALWLGMLLLLPSYLHASTCGDLPQQINHDINQKNGTAEQAEWRNLSWLQTRLGAGKETKLGNNTQYQWHCSDNSDMYITVLINSANKVIQVDGEYSSSNGAGIFSATFKNEPTISNAPPLTPQTPIIVKEETTASTIKKISPIENSRSSENQKLFNTWFNTNLMTDKQVEEVAIQKAQQYYSHLRQCASGTYQYPVMNKIAGRKINNKIEPTYFFGETTILGHKDKHCLVKIMVRDHQGQTKRTQCAFTPKTLKFFTDKRAGYLAHGKSSFQLEELSALTDFSQAIKKECLVELTAEDLEAQKLNQAFGSSLAHCTPGKFQILTPHIWQMMDMGTGILSLPTQYTLEVANIVGLKHDNCIVEMYSELDGEPLHMHCGYDSTILKWISDQKLGNKAPELTPAGRQEMGVRVFNSCQKS